MVVESAARTIVVAANCIARTGRLATALKLQFYFQPTANGTGSTLHGLQGYGGVGRIKQAIQRRTTGRHTFGHSGFAQPMLSHFLMQLASDLPLDGDCRGFTKQTFLVEKVVEVAADVSLAH